MARLDRKRKKRMSNEEWKSPADRDAGLAKMKEGRTHLAHKAEHGVALDTGAVVAVTLQGRGSGRRHHSGFDVKRGGDGGGLADGTGSGAAARR